MSAMLIAACYLHNYCIDTSIAWAEFDAFGEEDIAAMHLELTTALGEASQIDTKI
jgi:hypothetical protein